MHQQQQPNTVTNDNPDNHHHNVAVTKLSSAGFSDRKGNHSHRRKFVRTPDLGPTGTDRTARRSPPPQGLVGREIITAPSNLELLRHGRDKTLTMNSSPIDRRAIAAAAGIALIMVGAVTAGCGSSSNQTPLTTTTTKTSPQSSTAAPPPTEKSISPTGGNVFTPAIKAPPAPTVPPGQHPGLNGIP